MTNPNPVAPKADTPATQIPEDLRKTYALAKQLAYESYPNNSSGQIIELIERIGRVPRPQLLHTPYPWDN